MTADDWLRLWWLPLGVVVVGGLVLAGVLAVFSDTVRKKFWRPILRPFRWLATVRPTTTGKQRASRDELVAARADAVRISGTAVEEIVRLQRDTESDRNLAAANLAAAREEVEALNTLVSQRVAAADLDAYQRGYAAGLAEGREEIQARIDAERSVPLPRPAWRIDAVRSNDVYTLSNTQPGVVVRDLSMEAPLGDFQFNGPKYWPGEFEENIEFEGERMRNGKSFGVKFVLRWSDANGDRQLGEAWMDKEPRRGVVL
ncbi:hypothetical protein ACX3O0_07035 [Homoserinimonas sp. A447]